MGFEVADLSLAEEGRKKIAWAKRNMPVLGSIRADFAARKPLNGLKVAVSVHVEAKTANLALTLAEGGAQVALTGCNPLSTQDDVAAALAEGGMAVYAVHDVDEATYRRHLNAVLDIRPDIIVDDGGDLVQLLHHERRDLAGDLIAGCEETTTGVRRLQALERKGELLFPMVAVNDARSKHLFDNRYGTGQSTLTAILSATNLLLAGKTVVVAGYGMCGKGVAKRAMGMGARVVVTEIDPVCAAEAVMDGCTVMPMEQAAPIGDLFVTVTGCIDVIDKRHFALLKDGAILCNAGHFDVEINLKQLSAMAVETYPARDHILTYVLPGGRRVNVLAQGRLVNLAAGDGHPVEIMDMSFALQARSVEYIARHGKELPVRVIDVPREVDDGISRAFLASYGADIDELTEAQARYRSESW